MRHITVTAQGEAFQATLDDASGLARAVGAGSVSVAWERA